VNQEQLRHHTTTIRKLAEGEAQEKDILDLVHFSHAIVLSYFETMRYSLATLCLQQGLTMSDLAYDAIAEAFTRDENGKFSMLQNFISSLEDEVANIPKQKFFFAFKNFLIKIAETQLARLYALNDPVGAKLHRNIRECVKNSSTFTLMKDFRGIVLSVVDGNASDHLPQFPVEELENAMYSAGKKSSLPELLSVLHGCLIGQIIYRRSLSLIDVVQVLKRMIASEYEHEIEPNFRVSEERLGQNEIRQIKNDVEIALKEKIVLTYLAKGKINRTEAEAFYHAMQDVLDGWSSDDGTELSLFDCFKKHFDIDEHQYETIYRSKIEYLLRIAREEFAARLMREL
jgi:hypothetical protein